jgi:WD40 repeat protein
MEPITLMSGVNREMINDINFDWFGKRLAIATVENKLKIYDIRETEDGKPHLKLTSETLAHSGAIWKVKWAHPDFGPLLVTCSYDKHIIGWQPQKIKSN